MFQAVDVAEAGDVDRRVDRREDVDYILAMSPHLGQQERLLIEHVYRDGRSAADYARIAGQNPRTVQKRVNTLVRRLYSDEYRFVVGHGLLLPKGCRRTARLLFLEGLGLRGAADRMGVSLHTVRGQRLEILARCRAHAEARERAAADLARRSRAGKRRSIEFKK